MFCLRILYHDHHNLVALFLQSCPVNLGEDVLAEFKIATIHFTIQVSWMFESYCPDNRKSGEKFPALA